MMVVVKMNDDKDDDDNDDVTLVVKGNNCNNTLTGQNILCINDVEQKNLLYRTMYVSCSTRMSV